MNSFARKNAEARIPIHDVRTLLKAVWEFAIVSSVGLTIDFGVFFLLISLGLTPAIANLVSATAAVTFVYFTSAARVFSYRGRFLLPLFAGYLVYQVLAVSLASLAIGHFVSLQWSPGVAKLLILPVSFSANFLFMWLLTRRRPPSDK